METIWPYILVILAMFVEGEFALLTTSIAAAHGLLDFPIAMACSFAGTFAADITHFYIGRSKGRVWLMRKEKWKNRVDNLEKRIERAPFKVLLGLRFLYGFRVIAPMIIGITSMTARRFLIYSVSTIAIWIFVYATLGFVFGNWISAHLVELEHSEKYVIMGFILLGAIYYLVRTIVRKKREKNLFGVVQEIQ